MDKSKRMIDNEMKYFMMMKIEEEYEKKMVTVLKNLTSSTDLHHNDIISGTILVCNLHAYSRSLHTYDDRYDRQIRKENFIYISTCINHDYSIWKYIKDLCDEGNEKIYNISKKLLPPKNTGRKLQLS